jgi:hypothetical protein
MLTGMVLPGGSATEQLEQAVLAEQAGWDGVFVWEAAYGVDAWSLLATMAARTSRARLGTMLTPLPWRRLHLVAGDPLGAPDRHAGEHGPGQGPAGRRSARRRRWLSSAEPSAPPNQRAWPIR